MKSFGLFSLAIFLSWFSAAASQISFSGNALPVLTDEAPASSGLNDIFIARTTAGLSAVYTADSPAAQVVWYRYSNLGGGFAEQVDGVVRNGSQWILPDIQGDMGYIIEEGTSRRYFWLVDYSAHPYSVESLAPGPESDCQRIELIPSGTAPRITYYSINGQGLTLPRDILLEYTTLEYNADTRTYTQKSVSESLDFLQSEIHADAPLCDTSFSLSGDRFLRQWGEEIVVETTVIPASAVQAHTEAVQSKREVDNEVPDTSADGALGGSAPAEITFSAAVTDAAVFTEWQISTYPEFDDIEIRFRETETTYTFRELGTFYVRFVCADNSGACEYTSEIYTVSIGSSALLCPNAFSPGASEGVNDEWKVSYRSIVDFECHIFNRNGVKLFSFRDPSLGWDGKYNGKLVPAGVYFYVIKATGADGKKYDLAGDINIVGYR